MTKERLAELQRWRTEHDDALGVSMVVFGELLDALAIATPNTVYLVQDSYEEFAVVGVYATKDAAEMAAAASMDVDVKEWEVQR